MTHLPDDVTDLLALLHGPQQAEELLRDLIPECEQYNREERGYVWAMSQMQKPKISANA